MSAQRVVAGVASLVAFCALIATAWVLYGSPGAVSIEERRAGTFAESGDALLISVESGESAKEIGAKLQAQQIIRSGRLFEVLVGLTGVAGSLEAGEYEFEPGTPAIEAVHRIAQGRTASRQVVIPEGLRMEEVGEILGRQNIVPAQEFRSALIKDEYAEPFLSQFPGDSLEGFLFPARYEFNRSTDAAQVVATMLRGFQDNVADALQLEGQDLTLQQVVTLASIVEREALTAEERPLIASVFLNRLRLSIPLQADPTVQYALAQDPQSVAQYGWWKRELTFDDLRVDSPYNTYVYPDLPPGPIANPGLASMQAVIRPAQTNYLFFVARDDGTHVFAETLEEHLMNVERYRPPGG